MSNPIISANKLSRTFKTRGNKNVITGMFDPRWQHFTAVKNITFDIVPGEAVAFLGPNGAGKTTTTKMLCGLIYPTSGSVSVLGYTPQERNPELLKQIGLVMGNRAGLNWDLTARQSFELLRHIYKIEPEHMKKRLNELTKMLDVDHRLDLQVRRLSLGERMKLELIASIIHEPKVLFLDEPTIGLDVTAKQQVRDFLKHLQKEKGLTFVLTSHDMDDIASVCERVIIIDHGKLIYDDSLAKLLKTYQTHRYIRLQFDAAAPIEAIKEYGQAQLDEDGSATLVVSAKNLPSTLSAVLSELSPRDVAIESVPLDTIIADIFAKHK